MQTLEFRLDTVALLNEIADAGLDRRMGVLKIPLNVLRMYLGKVAQRAAELDDPKLNILMLQMHLYEVPNEDVMKRIEEQRERAVCP